MYLGEVTIGGVLNFKFTTRAFATGVPTTLSGSPALCVYKSNSTSEETTGVTLTVDFDSKTGLNHVKIDTSADATFYATASDFEVVITAGTVGGTSVVGEVVGHFSILHRTTNGNVTASDGTSYVVQGEWSNTQNACVTGPAGSN